MRPTRTKGHSLAGHVVAIVWFIQRKSHAYETQCYSPYDCYWWCNVPNRAKTNRNDHQDTETINICLLRFISTSFQWLQWPVTALTFRSPHWLLFRLLPFSLALSLVCSIVRSDRSKTKEAKRKNVNVLLSEARLAFTGPAGSIIGWTGAIF